MSNGPSGDFLSIGEGLPRICNFLTVLVGLYFLFIEEPGWTDFGLTTQQLGGAMCVLGIHGVFTSPKKVGFIRKFLSYMGAAPGAFAIFIVAKSFLESL